MTNAKVRKWAISNVRRMFEDQPTRRQWPAAPVQAFAADAALFLGVPRSSPKVTIYVQTATYEYDRRRAQRSEAHHGRLD